MFWQNRTDDVDKNIFIIDKNKEYSFNDIFMIADDFISCVPTGSVVLIDCDRKIDAICSYIGALRNKVTPLLIDSDINDDIVSKIANLYKIEFIFSCKNRKLKDYNFYKKLNHSYIYNRKKVNFDQIFKDLCLIMLTSGSTGESKCVRISKNNLCSVTKSIVRYLELNHSRVSINSLPLHYIYGLSVLNCSLESRSSFVLNDKSWLERDFWKTVEQNQVTDLSGVPFMFQLLKNVKLSSKVLKNLKCVNQAGGRLDDKLIKHFNDYFLMHKIKFFIMYGATEASPRISYVPHDKLSDNIGSVGIPIDIGKLYTDSDDKVSEGELIYEGPNVCLGYAHNRKDLSLNDTNNNIFKTGDVGIIDKNGYVKIIGRKKDL